MCAMMVLTRRVRERNWMSGVLDHNWTSSMAICNTLRCEVGTYGEQVGVNEASARAQLFAQRVGAKPREQRADSGWPTHNETRGMAMAKQAS